ncbi:hypothetical protein LMG28138_04699 [Pararobbsia alpina]|uniref:OmpR/PhoB-type domain-containing protein n=1 Tax=Pararobbsia alpina TaxID=621374 RepID=A0A6S7BHF0_9BURK|nr:hypothetical protein LMG28138_04699 [Pararobbsia alpina]
MVGMGVEVTISAKERILLDILMGSAGQIRSKDELLSLVWPERAGWNDSTNLTQLVSKLRRSLRPTGTDKSIITCGRNGYKFVQPGSTTPVKFRGHGVLLAILLVSLFSAALSYFCSELMFDRHASRMVEKKNSIKGVRVTLHIVDSLSLQPEWILSALEDSIDSSATDIFAARCGEVVYIATLGKHGGKTKVIDLESK